MRTNSLISLESFELKLALLSELLLQIINQHILTNEVGDFNSAVVSRYASM